MQERKQKLIIRNKYAVE